MCALMVSAAHLFALVHQAAAITVRGGGRAHGPMAGGGFSRSDTGGADSRKIKAGIQRGSANVRTEPVQLVVGLMVPLRSCQVGPCAYFCTLSGQDRHIHAAFRSIDGSAPHRSMAQSQPSDCRRKISAPLFMRHQYSSLPLLDISFHRGDSPLERVKVACGCLFACGCED